MGIIKQLEQDVLEIKTELYKLCWYMRGGVNICDSYELSFDDRNIIAGIIKENLEITKKTQMPFF